MQERNCQKQSLLKSARKLNTEVQIHAFMDACVENLEELLENVDVIIDATIISISDL